MPKKQRKKYKSVITKRIYQSIGKISAVAAVAFLILSIGRIGGTDSLYMAAASVDNSQLSTGYWIPKLTMTVSPAEPDGQNGFYVTDPCVTLTSSLSDTTIYYAFTSGDETRSGTYAGSCLKVPAGEWDFSAYGIYKDNPNWKSDPVSQNFKVDLTDPVVNIENPNNGDTLSGTVDIEGAVDALYPKSYQLEIETDGGTVKYDETFDQTDSFSDKALYDWDTTKVDNGDYRIILNATDQAGRLGHKEIDVTVYNAQPGDVIINEVMWPGSTTKGGNDEWVELRNTTDHDIDLKNWRIDNAASSGGDLEIAGGKSATISAHGYFLISNYSQTDSAIGVSPNLVDSSLSLNNNYKDNGKLVLKDLNGNMIDATPDPSGSSWPAGSNGDIKESMERNNDPGDGLYFPHFFRH